jgi:hypothetical protein
MSFVSLQVFAELKAMLSSRGIVSLPLDGAFGGVGFLSPLPLGEG